MFFLLYLVSDLSILTLSYLLLARISKRWSEIIQIHSIIHCLLAFLFSSYYLLYILQLNYLETNITLSLSELNYHQEVMIRLIVEHSIGYFIADTIDILISQNPKRYVYIYHHLAALIGLSTIYWNSYLAIYCLWVLEMGGMVHHLKFISETTGHFILVADVLYHVVYLSSRILLMINVYNGFFCYQNEADLVGLIIAVFLFVQNMIWWLVNLKKSFHRIDLFHTNIPK